MRCFHRISLSVLAPVLFFLPLLLSGRAPAAPAPTLPSPEVRLLLLIYNPVIEAEENKRLNQVMGWGDPDQLTKEVIHDLGEASGGYARYRVAERVELDEYAALVDGFRYTDESFLKCAHNRWQGVHKPEGVDYRAIIRDQKLVEKVNGGKIDEVWMWGAPYFGYWESTMVGTGAYWCNSSPVEGVKSKRRFVIMGFNYERGVGEALESYGHRTESILEHHFGPLGADPNKNPWRRFTLYDKIAPGRAQCGNIHFAPNSERDYDWGNPRKVPCFADDWLTYPKAKGAPREVDCLEWGCGDSRVHKKWWYNHLPKAPGKTNGRLNNWWEYVVRFWQY